jgi:hypothetical protein
LVIIYRGLYIYTAKFLKSLSKNNFFYYFI